jgi:hypothetical protein
MKFETRYRAVQARMSACVTTTGATGLNYNRIVCLCWK